jgi:hypothetical protein
MSDWIAVFRIYGLGDALILFTTIVAGVGWLCLILDHLIFYRKR